MTIPRLDLLDKNYIINGAFDFWQRHTNTTAVDGVPAYYCADRWKLSAINQGQAVLRSTDVPANSFATYSLEWSATIANNNRRCITEQRIESVFAKELANKYVSFGFDYKSQSAIQMTVKLSYANAADNFAAVTQIYSRTFSISAAGAWASDAEEDILMPTNAKNGVVLSIEFHDMSVLSSASHKLTNIKLNQGSKVQNFSYSGRDYFEELMRCQRYYEKSYTLDTPPGTVTNAGILGAAVPVGNPGVQYPFKVMKRTAPTMAFYNSITGASASWRLQGPNTNHTATVDSNRTNQYTWGVSISGATTGNEIDGHFTADAEL